MRQILDMRYTESIYVEERNWELPTSAVNVPKSSAPHNLFFLPFSANDVGDFKLIFEDLTLLLLLLAGDGV